MTSSTRRAVLTLGLMVAVGGAATATRATIGAGEGAVERAIRTRLSYLTFGQGSVEAFAAALREAYPSRSSRFSRVRAHPRKALIALLRGFMAMADIDRVEERICTEFLLSSDFFQNGADVTRPVKFIGYTDPYSSPCSNPLAVIPSA